MCFGADDYGQSKTEISEKNANPLGDSLVVYTVRCFYTTRVLLSDFCGTCEIDVICFVFLHGKMCLILLRF